MASIERKKCVITKRHRFGGWRREGPDRWTRRCRRTNCRFVQGLTRKTILENPKLFGLLVGRVGHREVLVQRVARIW